jgi:outer membrane receptor protein involved in Fe transport
MDTVSLDLGVRYEHAEQTVDPIQVFADAPGGAAGTLLENNYWLPAATLTWEVQPELQLRLSASKTIARPQFRELIYQPYFDPESNRQYLGNPLLVDSQLYNAEARVEWYFDTDQRVSASAFYKKIDRPIEAFVTQLSGAFLTSYANAPEAQLYGGEVEFQKYFDLGWDERRVVLIGNYTFTQSRLKVAADDTVTVFASSSGVATDFFRDGAPLTGQSDHLVNLQLGLEADDHLSQQTILVTYASDRVVSRGLNGTPPQPDVIERPGLRIDFVAREGFTLLGQNLEAKLEVRNILGRKHAEFQQSGANRIEINTYDVGTTVAVSLSADF